MSVNEISLQGSAKNSITSPRVLGTVGMICAPMLYVASLFYSADGPASPYKIIGCLSGIAYLTGIICSTIGLRRMRVTGSGMGSKILFVVQIIGLCLAMMNDVLEYAAPQTKDTVIYFVADMAYPFSHVLMIIVGVAIVRAKVWRGWRLIPAFMVGFALLLFFPAVALFGRETIGFIFPVLAIGGFILLGYAIRTSSNQLT